MLYIYITYIVEGNKPNKFIITFTAISIRTFFFAETYPKHPKTYLFTSSKCIGRRAMRSPINHRSSNNDNTNQSS